MDIKERFVGPPLGLMLHDGRSLLSEEDITPATIDRYRVTERLGSGGMGVVLAAWDEQLARSVAIKLLRPQHRIEPCARARFMREAQAMAQLSHPNVVQVFEVGECGDDRVFVVMERIEGITLSRWAKPRRGWRPTLALYQQAGRGLMAAHDAGLLHRDFKPANVMLGDDGRVRVLDFGLARGIEPDESTSLQPRHRACDSIGFNLTQTDVVVGTPAYMPPEALAGDRLDERSDQFAFCVSLYEALYGVHPRVAASCFASGDPCRWYGPVRPPPPGSRVPGALRRVVVRGLALEPKDRWPSMKHLLDRLDRLTSSGAKRTRLGLAVMAVVGSTVAIGSAGTEHSCGAQARAQMRGVWSAGRRAALGQALRATEHPLAEETWAHLTPVLDVHAQTWVDAREQACEALRADGPRQLQDDGPLACLEHQRRRLEVLLELIAESGVDGVQRAQQAAARLPTATRCLEARSQGGRSVSPPDESVAEAVVELRARLTRAETLGDMGRYGEGRDLAYRVADLAQGLGYVPLLAEAERLGGWLEKNSGDYRGSARRLERAYFLARQADHDRVAGEAALDRAYVAAVLHEDHAGAERWLRDARAMLDRSSTPRREARFHTLIGVLHGSRGQLDAAQESYERALALQERIEPPSSLGIAAARFNLCLVHTRRGRPARALESCQRALALDEQIVGPGHPRIARTSSTIAALLSALGRHAEALELGRRSLAAIETVLGSEHAETAWFMATLGELALAAGRDDMARQWLERGFASQQRSLGEDHHHLATTMNQLAGLERRAGDLERARGWLHDAIALITTSLGVEHPRLVPPLVDLSRIERDAGQLARAAKHAERAVAIAEPIGAHARADARFALAQVRWAQGDHARAWRLAEKAKDDYAAWLSTDGRVVLKNVGVPTPQDVDAWLDEHSMP